jgi:hypothetical protein
MRHKYQQVDMMCRNNIILEEFKPMILRPRQQLRIKLLLANLRLSFMGPPMSNHFRSSKYKNPIFILNFVIISSSPNFKQDSNSSRSKVSKNKSKKSGKSPKTFNVDKMVSEKEE